MCYRVGWPLNRGKEKIKGNVHCVLIKSISSPRKRFLNITFIRFSQKQNRTISLLLSESKISSKDCFHRPVISDNKMNTLLTTKMNTMIINELYFYPEPVQSHVRLASKKKRQPKKRVKVCLFKSLEAHQAGGYSGFQQHEATRSIFTLPWMGCQHIARLLSKVNSLIHFYGPDWREAPQE